MVTNVYDAFSPPPIPKARERTIDQWIVKLTPFDGVGVVTADSHLLQFVQACRFEGYDKPDDLMRFFPVFIIGVAMQWYLSMMCHSPHLIKTWDGLGSAFVARFSPILPSCLVFGTLLEFFQGEGEPIDEYVKRFQTFKMKQCDPHCFDERVLLEFFLTGMLRDIQFHVRLSDPKKLDDAYARARVVGEAFGATALVVQWRVNFDAELNHREGCLNAMTCA
ncbi:hypothetical protein GOP47_0011857 [Adiantum capillus-veneris]|uniref:Retrotransposon gag domain-containing protein n=1 Tax=Adiantum capillus-veneris TaxID=13818 RepID=A0A9D4UTY6_ADICA|nr:hypothetical protein GOP47_0011857 [Adiantum capillus-veneris]